MKFGLSEAVLLQIIEVFQKFPQVKAVSVFGSRALGRYRPGSDIDLALEGEALSFDDMLSIRLELDNLMLPYRFDLIDRTKVEKSLQDHIDRVSVRIYE